MAETDIPNWLNSSFFETALRSGGYGPNVTVTSSEVGRATGPGENYGSEMLRANLQVTVDGRRSTLSLIVKSIPKKGQMAKVNILFCLTLHMRDFHRILNCNTLSIFLLHIYNVHICIYVLQICRSLWDLIILYTERLFLQEIFQRKSAKLWSVSNME